METPGDQGACPRRAVTHGTENANEAQLTRKEETSLSEMFTRNVTGWPTLAVVWGRGYAGQGGDRGKRDGSGDLVPMPPSKKEGPLPPPGGTVTSIPTRALEG